MIVRWIAACHTAPSLLEVCAKIKDAFGVERDPDSIRHRKEVNNALSKKKAADKLSSVVRNRPTLRKQNRLEAKVAGLILEVEALENQVASIIEENLRLRNSMKARNIPEPLHERPIMPVDRDPSERPGRSKEF